MGDDLTLDAQMRPQLGHELAYAGAGREHERAGSVAGLRGAYAHATRSAGPLQCRLAVAQLGVPGARAFEEGSNARFGVENARIVLPHRGHRRFDAELRIARGKPITREHFVPQMMGARARQHARHELARWSADHEAAGAAEQRRDRKSTRLNSS